MESRRIARGMAWLVGACLVLVIGLYLAVVALNWSDEAPSADAQALAQVLRDRPAVADADNAYVYFLGLSAPLNEDPFAQGQARQRFLEQLPAWIPGHDVAHFPGREIAPGDTRTPAMAALADACLQDAPTCVQRMRQADPALLAQWLASESWLRDRYTRLVQLQQWRETGLKDYGTPTPSYLPARYGQLLLLVQALHRARTGDGEGARAMLQQDLVFWRMVLRSSDTLITKMVATASIERDFALGNLVLRELHAAGKPATPPDAWREPISAEERGMLRAFAGEWTFHTGSMPSIVAMYGQEHLADRLKRPMIKVQAMNNLSATHMRKAAALFDADYPALPQAARTNVTAPPRDTLLQRAYNPFGYTLYREWADSGLNTYGVRVSDLEGERRAALLAVALRDDGATPADALHRIQSSPLKDPYTGQSFGWAPDTHGIVFTGLAKGTRARHELLL